VPCDEDNAKQKAKLVNDISRHYHLSHAVFACNKILESEFKDYLETKTAKLRERLLAAEKSNDQDRIAEILRDTDRLKRPFRIYVDYFGYSDDENMVRARAVHLADSNQFVIYLPKALLDKSINEARTYNADVVKRLRRLMAHELGHIILHTKELLDDQGTQGSTLLSGNADTEREADIFADELLHLRRERNGGLFTTGIWEMF
jgi:hypothetical protein